MNALIVFILLQILFLSTARAQREVSGKILSAKTQEAIPFATVISLRTKQGARPDAYGAFKLILSETAVNDTLVFNAVGYLPHKLAVKDVQIGANISLMEDVKTLREVTITDKAREKVVGNYKVIPKTTRVNYGGEWARRFVMPENYEYIKEVRVAREIGYHEFSSKTKFRIHFYLADSKTKGPGQRISHELIEVDDFDNSTIVVSLSKYDIQIKPGTVFFISIETLNIPVNERYLLQRVGPSSYGEPAKPHYFRSIYQPLVHCCNVTPADAWQLLPFVSARWESMGNSFAPAVEVIVN
ncbi:carboxypeptidase-like regulatory domain-containing protein [Pedobacter deserti]|uniref:carboxypeptidase-like regulatory domain-containing protein n=1 Tax=Pedobacter deserti TaxID=2817382 RepID=UPI00210C53C3|nr:carboxypeptidase-like regulatory domain-containing protein [Pedobacter sp. SYSU D00382]